MAYHFFKKDPAKIITTLTKVETKIQQVEKVVTKDRIVYVDRVIVTKKANGDVITETDHINDKTTLHADTNSSTKTQSTVTKQTVETFMKNYSLEAMFPMPIATIGLPNIMDTQLSFGMRIFSFPLFAVIGTTPRLNTLLVGVRVEF